jgi:hypothetical protein
MTKYQGQYKQLLGAWALKSWLNQNCLEYSMVRRAEAKLYISCEHVQISLLETDMHTLLQKQNSFPSMDRSVAPQSINFVDVE